MPTISRLTTSTDRMSIASSNVSNHALATMTSLLLIEVKMPRRKVLVKELDEGESGDNIDGRLGAPDNGGDITPRLKTLKKIKLQCD